MNASPLQLGKFIHYQTISEKRADATAKRIDHRHSYGLSVTYPTALHTASGPKAGYRVEAVTGWDAWRFFKKLGVSILRTDSLATQSDKMYARTSQLARENKCSIGRILMEAMDAAFNAHIAAGKPVQDLGTDLIG